jgi:two-component system, OmpR family, sensor histidine kinase MtrB
MIAALWSRLLRLWGAPLRLWRTSLLTRTVAITVTLSGAAVTVIGGYMSLTIAESLFNGRVNQILSETASATTTAQALFDNSVTAAGTIDVETANTTAQTAIRSTQSSPGGSGFAILRTPGQITPQTMTSTSTAGLDLGVVSPMLRSKVVTEPDQIHYQSVSVTVAGQTRPGIVTATSLQVPSAGQYELYLIYDLADVQATLTLIQQTLIAGSLALVITIGVVTFFVVRLAIGPVRRAAQTAERLAEGYLEERLTDRGEDVIAVLARSFNKMADSMQRQIVRLANLSKVQQRFVSDVSHELRTPLTTIRLAGDVLYEQRASFTKENARTIELLMTQIERFEIMLTDLLEMSRYDAGAVALEVDEVNIVPLVEDCLDQLGPLAVQKGSKLILEVRGGYGTCEVDQRRIRRIVLNFLGNAIDHGEGKDIVTFIDSTEEAVSIAVRDWGVGMSAEEESRVFDRFWRADPSRQRTTGGTGLGLAIASEDAIAHGGQIDVWSEPGEGSCFRLTIPRSPLAAWNHSPLPLPPEPTPDSEPIVVDASEGVGA